MDMAEEMVEELRQRCDFRVDLMRIREKECPDCIFHTHFFGGPACVAQWMHAGLMHLGVQRIREERERKEREERKKRRM